jgi:hypothetical protein
MKNHFLISNGRADRLEGIEAGHKGYVRSAYVFALL